MSISEKNLEGLISEEPSLSGDEAELDGPSELAITLRALKHRAISAFDKRQKVPYELFWSLFHSEIDLLRKKKAQSRDTLLRNIRGVALDDD